MTSQIPDFGKITSFHEGVELSCSAVVPGKSLHDLVMAFDAASKEASESDRYSGDPSKWPTVRGVKAVLDMALNAIYAAPRPPARDAEETLVEMIACNGDFQDTVSEAHHNTFPQHDPDIEYMRKIARAAALAERDRAGAEGWQPIDSAPKDGTTIIVFRPKHDGTHIPQVGVDHWGFYAGRHVWGESRVDTPPTHWRPFPAPPAP